MRLRTTARTAMAQGIITDAGNGAKLRFYDGAPPAGLGAVTGGNNLLAEGAFVGEPIGTATGGTIDWDEAAFDQDNTNHVAGTPTFVDITTSADALVSRVLIGSGADEWQFSSSIQPNRDIELEDLVWTMPNGV